MLWGKHHVVQVYVFARASGAEASNRNDSTVYAVDDVVVRRTTHGRQIVAERSIKNYPSPTRPTKPRKKGGGRDLRITVDPKSATDLRTAAGVVKFGLENIKFFFPRTDDQRRKVQGGADLFAPLPSCHRRPATLHGGGERGRGLSPGIMATQSQNPRTEVKRLHTLTLNQ